MVVDLFCCSRLASFCRRLCPLARSSSLAVRQKPQHTPVAWQQYHSPSNTNSIRPDTGKHTCVARKADSCHHTVQHTVHKCESLLLCCAACCSCFQLGTGVIQTLATSTTEVAEPFLLPEMVQRIANMLNYFLLYLTGPNRKMLKVLPGSWCIQQSLRTDWRGLLFCSGHCIWWNTNGLQWCICEAWSCVRVRVNETYLQHCPDRCSSCWAFVQDLCSALCKWLLLSILFCFQGCATRSLLPNCTEQASA